MVVATEADLVAQIVVGIGSTVAIGVDGFGDLGHLGHHDMTWSGSFDAKAVVEATGKELPNKAIRVGGGFGDKNIITPGGGVEIAIRVKSETSDFGWGALG